MSAVLDTLTRVRTRLSDSKRWTKGLLARDSSNRRVDPDDPKATCWCLLGALRVEKDDSEHALDLLSTLLDQDLDVDDFNDHESTTHDDVLDLLDKAILTERMRNAD